MLKEWPNEVSVTESMAGKLLCTLLAINADSFIIFIKYINSRKHC